MRAQQTGKGGRQLVKNDKALKSYRLEIQHEAGSLQHLLMFQVTICPPYAS